MIISILGMFGMSVIKTYICKALKKFIYTEKNILHNRHTSVTSITKFSDDGIMKKTLLLVYVFYVNRYISRIVYTSLDSPNGTACWRIEQQLLNYRFT